ncbi:MAG: glycosyltransferase [Candidatus Eremiobacteraeota bacterium]|nr:glycosyltransferase [Candidatus Eremiobacteraeota bacterium]MBV8355325.1 glycosyltransferase [Candidatus Eremiobacteraeota bacterium]
MLACALCVGSSPEPYLEATLASIAPVVDLLVVNDNSGLPRSPSLATLEASAFAQSGRLHVVQTRFVNFATMRNDAFAALAARAAPDWVLWLDADEVHREQLVALVRGLLPRLDRTYATVDGYTDHFLGSFDWISDVARRLCAYRFTPDLRWRNAVHEKMEGLHGRSLVLPYRYAHYGNVLPPELYAIKDLRYLDLGNVVDYTPPLVEAATLENIYGAKGRRARRFRGTHPPAARPVIERLRSQWAGQFAEIDRLFTAAQTPRDRVANGLRGALEESRVALRRVTTRGLSFDGSA